MKPRYHGCPDGELRRRRGAGTLLLIVFIVVACLFVLGLMQWYAGMVTRGNKIFNEGNMARALAESAINEVELHFHCFVNSYPRASKARKKAYAEFLADGDGEARIPAKVTTELARRAVDKGGYGLGKSFPVIEVTIRAVNERKITEVDRRGLLLFECEVFVGSYRRKITRAHEYYRYAIVPPHKLGQYTFAAFNWTYYLRRYEVYMYFLLQHKLVRGVVAWLLGTKYERKAEIASRAKAYARRVAGAVFAGGGGETRSGRPDYNVVKLAMGLDQYQGKYQGASVGLGWRDPPRAQFTLPYFARLVHLDESPLRKASAMAARLPITREEQNRYKFRKEFSDISSFLPALDDPLALDAAQIHALDRGWREAYNRFIENDRAAHFLVGDEGSDKPILTPVYVKDVKKVRSAELIFWNTQLPTQSMGGRLHPALAERLPHVQLPPPSGAIQPRSGGKQRGAQYFFLDPVKDLGLQPGGAESVDASGASPSLGMCKRLGNLQGRTAAEVLANLEASGSNEALVQYAEKLREGGAPFRPPPNFAEDVRNFVKFAQWWKTAIAHFSRLHTGPGTSAGDGVSSRSAEGQLPRHERLLKFAKIHPDGNIDSVLAASYMSDKYNIERACYRFPDAKAFLGFIERQRAYEPRGVMKLGGLYFIDGDDPVTLPKSYTGTGVIAAKGSISCPQGIEKYDPEYDGNLVLIAGKDVFIGGKAMQCGVLAKGSVRAARPGDGRFSGDEVRIEGNLIVGDTRYTDQDRPALHGKGMRRVLRFYTEDENNRLPNFTVEHDENLVDDKNFALIVLCPYRNIQLIERARTGLGRLLH